MTVTVEVVLRHNPLAFVYRLFTPTIEVNGLAHKKRWGTHRFQLAAGEKRRVTYSAGLIRYLPGKIDVR